MGGRAVWLLTCGLLAGCGGAPAAETPEGEWVGVLSTTAGTCPDQQPSDLVVSKTDITFVPGDGVLALHGHRAADPDALHAQELGLDMNHHRLPMVLDARFADGAVSGTYGTPTCRADVSLHRLTRTGLQRVLGG